MENSLFGIQRERPNRSARPPVQRLLRVSTGRACISVARDGRILVAAGGKQTAADQREESGDDEFFHKTVDEPSSLFRPNENCKLIFEQAAALAVLLRVVPRDGGVRSVPRYGGVRLPAATSGVRLRKLIPRDRGVRRKLIPWDGGVRRLWFFHRPKRARASDRLQSESKIVRLASRGPVNYKS